MDKRSATVVVFLKEGGGRLRGMCGRVFDTYSSCAGVSHRALNFLPFNLQVLEIK